MLKLYKSKQPTSLQKMCFILYLKKVSKTSKTSNSFTLDSLPPTSATGKYHSCRTYFTVQEWLGNVIDLDPRCWAGSTRTGWIMTDIPVAPE